ncbi:DUF418 domain-containing protein [Paenibacillus beijingensis]|uniref:DUF418 domain-containing protein n=1 Tax=Paenibacillus beijingensis TaxID=1126833 RepID=A0A0D5NHI1_9BACL|nr:DUF418 domain-containing protein [Paenibacillus beijingensis]AJY74839.1 hypothetical protein VN24_09860 [Paenibacillus beijingensis]
MKLLPASSAERISTIDILRGLAVFGIFFVNILYMSTTSVYFERSGVVPAGESAVNQGVKLVIELFLSGKCYPILAFLFGVGFFILLSRAEQKGMRIYSFFLKRMLILYLIGAAHMLFFYGGDILRTYGLLGCLLLLFYRRKERTVLRWAISILIVFLLMFSLSFLQPAADLKESQSKNYTAAQQDSAAAIVAYQSGNYREWLAFHLNEDVLPALAMEPITYPSTFGMMLLGFYGGRIRLFQRIAEFIPLLRKIRIISGLISLLVTALLAMARLKAIDFGVYETTAAQYLIYGFGIFLSLYYMSTILLALQKPFVKKLLHPFQYAGRMTLTNYLLQSVISIVVFAGFGLYLKLNLVMVVGYCFVVILAEIGFSRWWMSRFPFGPMEWVWRRLTYGKLEQAAKASISGLKIGH